MSGESETCIGHSPLVNRACNQHVNVPVLQVGGSAFQCCYRAFRCLWRRLSRLDINIVRQTVEYVDFLWLRIFCGIDDIGVKLLQIMYEFAVESENLG